MALGFGHLIIAARRPKIIFLASILPIMQNQKIFYRTHFLINLPVEFINRPRLHLTIRDEPQKPQNIEMNEVNAGRFQRFQKSARQTNRHTVFVPLFAPHAGFELNEIGFGNGFPVEAR